MPRFVNVDKLTYAGNLNSLASARHDARHIFERVDICDALAIGRLFAEYRPDAVMHLAAESHVDRSIDGPAEFIQTNIEGTFVLLQAALAYWRELEEPYKSRFRFHHVSTDEVYGSLGDRWAISRRRRRTHRIRPTRRARPHPTTWSGRGTIRTTCPSW